MKRENINDLPLNCFSVTLNSDCKIEVRRIITEFIKKVKSQEYIQDEIEDCKYFFFVYLLKMIYSVQSNIR